MKIKQASYEASKGGNVVIQKGIHPTITALGEPNRLIFHGTPRGTSTEEDKHPHQGFTIISSKQSPQTLIMSFGIGGYGWDRRS
jgi:hypothetical protein